RDFNLSAEEVYDELIAIHQENKPAAKPTFTSDAEVALRRALEETQRSHFQKIGGDQLLLGLLQAQDSTAAQFLKKKGISLADAQVKLAELSLLEHLDYAVGRGDENHTPLHKCCSVKLRRATFQATADALASNSPTVTAACLLRGALRGENELVDTLRATDYPVDHLYRLLAPPAAGGSTAPHQLQSSPCAAALFSRMIAERQGLHDPALTTAHLLLAVLADTKSPLHDQLVSLGDINRLNHRRVLERYRAQRSLQAE
ncbi:MAG TPA: Clp protease N-terminal domain-containing protein, partial [bacterium]|nr:Clp protease N-terminal domain-containing protein [bacterium]